MEIIDNSENNYKEGDINEYFEEKRKELVEISGIGEKDWRPRCGQANWILEWGIVPFAIKFSPEKILETQQLNYDNSKNVVKYLDTALEIMNTDKYLNLPTHSKQLMRHCAEIISYCLPRANDIMRGCFSKQRLKMLETMASQIPLLIKTATDNWYVREYLDTSNRFWGLRYATAMTQRAINFADKLSYDQHANKLRVGFIRNGLDYYVSLLAKEAETHKDWIFYPSFSREEFNKWMVGLMNEDPNKQSIVSGTFFPSFRTLKFDY